MKKIRNLKIFVFSAGVVFLASCGGPLQYTKNGDTYYAAGDYEDAAAEYRRNVQYYESINYPLYMLNLAAADYRAGKLDEARRAFTVALKLSHGENLNAVEKNFGFLAPKSESSYKLRDYEEIIVHFYLGLIYVRMGEFDDAVVEFKKINLIDPEYPLVHFIMGKIYQINGNGEDAEIEFRLTNRYRKNFPYAYFEKAGFYRKNGMAEEADRALKKYLYLDGESRLAEEAKKNGKMPAGGIVLVLDASSWAGKIGKKNKGGYFYKIYIDGKFYGKSYLIEDMELNKIKKRTAKFIKETLKNAARSAIIKKVFGSDASDNTERRGWDKVPGLIHLFEAYLPAGEHKMKISLYAGDLAIESKTGKVVIDGKEEVKFLFY